MIKYQFQFGVVLAHIETLLAGAVTTIWMSVFAITSGFLIAVIFGLAARYGNVAFRSGVRIYVEVFRNTPFLVQLFFIYLALPEFGIRLTPMQAGLLAMSINAGAYLTEIVRAGLESVHRSQIEAGQSLGLTERQVFFDVIFKPAFTRVYPALQSQFILIMLGSSIISAISVPELTGSSGVLETMTARPFEIYIITGAIYFAIAVGLKSLLDLLVYKVWRIRPANSAR